MNEPYQYDRISKQPLGFLIDIDYNENIEDPYNYNDDLQVLRTASPNDVIRLHINNSGGYLHTLVQLVNNIRNCEGQVITILEGEAHSAAGALFLQADQNVIGSNCAMLIHEPTGGNFGSHDKVKMQHNFSVEYVEELFKDYYEGFLTKEEIDNVLSGSDLWLKSDQIMKRLENKAKYFEEINNKPLELSKKEKKAKIIVDK